MKIRTLLKNDYICPWIIKRHCSQIIIRLNFFFFNHNFLSCFLKNHWIFTTSLETHKMIFREGFCCRRTRKVSTTEWMSIERRIPRKYNIPGLWMELSLGIQCNFLQKLSKVETLPSNPGGSGSIPGQGVKIPDASWSGNQNIEQKRYWNKVNKGFNNSQH